MKQISMKNTIRLLFSCLFMFIVCEADATVKTWTGNISTEWNVTGNWSPIGLPTILDTVQTDYGDNIIIPLGYNAKVNRARIFGTFIMYGNLLVDGGGLEIVGDFANYGILKVENCDTYGIRMNSYVLPDTLIIENFGSIIVDNSFDDAMIGTQRIKLYNHGKIEITNYVDNGLFIEYGENNGEIRIDGSGDNAIFSDFSHDTLINNACGRMIVTGKWNLEDGAFINHGFLRQNSDINHYFLNDLMNHGTLEDINFNFTIPQVTNTGLWVRRLSISIDEGVEASIFTLSNAALFNFSDVYNDSSLTSNAGTYDNVLNRWTPNQSAAGDSIFFVEVTDVVEGCKDTVKLNLLIPVNAVNYWLGGVGNWNMANKWNFGTVPTATDKVAVYDGQADITIPNGVHASTSDLFFKGKLTINPTGSLTILEHQYTAMTCSSCDIINRGTINIETPNRGLFIYDGKLVNYKNINCDSMQTCISLSSDSNPDTSVYFKNYGNLHSAGGEVLSSTHMPIYNYDEIIALGITEIGIDTDDLYNYGNIEVTGESVIGNYGLIANLFNYSGGIVKAENLYNGISGILENHNQIEITNSQFGFSGSGTNEAGGNIFIDVTVTGINRYGDDFVNKDGGLILLQNMYNGIVVNDVFSSIVNFTNEGTLTIKDVLNAGILNGDEFINRGSGVITINNSQGDGIASFGAMDLFLNESSEPIIINDCDGHGFHIEEGVFKNEIGSTIKVDSIGLDGFHFKLGTSSPFVYIDLDNYGTLETTENVGGYSFYTAVDAPFVNQACSGIMISRGQIEMQSSFTNEGIIKQLTNTPTTVYPGFSNTGIIQDQYSVFQGTNFVNSGYHMKEKLGSYDAFDNVLDPIINDNSGTSAYTISSNWYLDSELILFGGTYDQSTNSLLLDAAAIDSMTFYFEIANTSCTPVIIDTLSLSFAETIEVACANIIWDGGTGSWSNSQKWDKNRLPNACDTVVILNLLDSVSLNGSQIIQVTSLKNEGTLNIGNVAELQISGSSGIGLLNNGKVRVNGTLTITDTGTNGYVGLANSLLSIDGILDISNAGSNAIVMTDAVVENKSNGIITLSNSNNKNIGIGGTSVFYQSGSLISN